MLELEFDIIMFLNCVYFVDKIMIQFENSMIVYGYNLI